jgi:hypothetical protein
MGCDLKTNLIYETRLFSDLAMLVGASHGGRMEVGIFATYQGSRERLFFFDVAGSFLVRAEHAYRVLAPFPPTEQGTHYQLLSRPDDWKLCITTIFIRPCIAIEM